MDPATTAAIVKEIPPLWRWWRGLWHKVLLVVEDDPAQSELLSYLIGRLGHSCDCVSTAEAGLEQVRMKHHAIAFLDVRLPMMNGFALAQKISRISPDTHIVIVAGLPQDLADAPPSCYLGMIVKPVSMESIQDAIRKSR